MDAQSLEFEQLITSSATCRPLCHVGWRLGNRGRDFIQMRTSWLELLRRNAKGHRVRDPLPFHSEGFDHDVVGLIANRD
jgi:hypothetical protein